MTDEDTAGCRSLERSDDTDRQMRVPGDSGTRGRRVAANRWRAAGSCSPGGEAGGTFLCILSRNPAGELQWNITSLGEGSSRTDLRTGRLI